VSLPGREKSSVTSFFYAQRSRRASRGKAVGGLTRLRKTSLMRITLAISAIFLAATSTVAQGAESQFVLTLGSGDSDAALPTSEPTGGSHRPAPPSPPTVADSCPFADVLTRATARWGIDPALVIGVAYAETRCRHVGQRSSKGAIGLMQLMPATARRFGASDPWNVDQNIAAGVAYLAWLDRRYGGDRPRILSAYNAGEAAVDRHNGIPPYDETKAYVASILARLDADTSEFPVAQARLEPVFVIDLWSATANALD